MVSLSWHARNPKTGGDAWDCLLYTSDGYQPASQGLFLPVAPHSTYLTIYAANEVWFALGDMTMAEHALSLIHISTQVVHL